MHTLHAQLAACMNHAAGNQSRPSIQAWEEKLALGSARCSYEYSKGGMIVEWRRCLLKVLPDPAAGGQDKRHPER